ncbi:MAG: F0F1 ATP synthase subunit gamma [Chloroflexota bacterium]
MTETLSVLRKQIETASDLYSVVTTMKVLASVNIRHCSHAVDALSLYLKTIEMGLQIALANRPDLQIVTTPESQNAIVILIGADKGLVGQFNERIVEYMSAQLGHPRDVKYIIYAVGARLAPALHNYGYMAETVRSIPGSISRITPAARDIVLSIDSWRQQHRVDRLMIFFNQSIGRATYTPQRINLLPLDPTWLNDLRQRHWDSASRPITRISISELFGQLTQQYLFATIYGSLAHSLASENASRLRIMENAEKNIEQRLYNLKHRYHTRRQDTITEELFDVISGFELLRDT